MRNIIGTAALCAAMMAAGSAYAFECKRGEASFDKPGGFPERALTMIVPYGPAGGSGQVAAAMAEAVTELTGIPINRDHKPGGSGTVGMTAYMAAPADGYNVLEHIDDASSAHALDSSLPNPAEDLIPLVVSQVTFSQVYIRTNETRFSDWPSFVEWVKAQDGKATIANVSKEGSMERVTMGFITDASGMQIQQISFDKGAPRYGALLGGQVDALFEPLLRFRGFYVHADAPADRVEWLKWAFQRGYCEDSYQAFNDSKFMTVIDSYRDTDGAKDLIARSIDQYREVYKAMGLDVK